MKNKGFRIWGWLTPLLTAISLVVLMSSGASAAMNAASLDGSYKIGELSNSLFKMPYEAPVYTIIGGNDIRATFYGDGSCVLTYYGKEFHEGYGNPLPTSVSIYGDNAPTAATSCSYAVDPDGAVTLSVGTTEGPKTISGWHVSADGETLLKSDVFSEPFNGSSTYHTVRLMAGIKVGSGKTTASLTGRYMIAEMDTTLYKPALPVDSTINSFVGGNPIQLDITGDGTCTVSSNWKEFSEGFASGSSSPLYDQVTYSVDTPPTQNCIYFVADDGAVELLIGGSELISGWHVSANGKRLLKSSITPDTSQHGTAYSGKIFVGMQLSPSSNVLPSILNGMYNVAAFESTLFKPSNSSVRSIIGGDDIRIFFDGSSTCSVRSASSEFEEGHLPGTSSVLYNKVALYANPLETPTCEYTVGAVGDLTLTINGTEIIGGWLVSGDGSMILKSEVISEPTNDNNGTRNSAKIFVGTKIQGALPGTAAGDYTLVGDQLSLNWTASSFPCDSGPTVGTSTQTVTSLTATTMTWLDGNNIMTWTRSGGTAGDITGEWFTTEQTTGNTFSAVFGAGAVTVSGNISQCRNQRVKITGFSPAFGLADTQVTIYGENFSHTTPGNYVWFNGVPATVTAVSDAQLTVTVPTGATTGQIAISNPMGTAASSNSFTVAAGFVNYTSRVTKSDGTSLPGVLIELLGTGTTTTTDVNGTFTITVPSQATIYLRMSLDGYLPAVSSGMSFTQDTDTSNRPFALFTATEQNTWYSQAATTKVPGSGVIYSRSVSVRNPLMTLPGVTLTATNAADGTTTYPVCYTVSNVVSCGATTTESNGKFYIFNVPNGTQVNVTAVKNDYTDGTKTYQVATDTVSEGRISLATNATSYVFTGKVTDSTSAALSGVSVTLSKDDNSPIGNTSTDSNGVFLAADMLANTTYYLKFTKTDFLPMLSSNMSISADVDSSGRAYTQFPAGQITIWGFDPGQAVISGSVKDSFTSSGIAGATIKAVDAGSPTTEFLVKYDNDDIGTNSVIGSSASTTTTKGRFYVYNVPAGTKVAITATVSGYTSGTRYYHTAAGTLSQGSIYLNSSAGGNISASPTSINFGNVPVGSSATPQTITISNTGPGSITISASSMDGDMPQLSVQPDGGPTSCPQSLPAEFPAGLSCTLVANFAPAYAGAKSANLYITSTAANFPTLTIPLSGNGVSAPSAPLINSITPWDTEATLNFSAPVSDGGSPILDYTVTVTPGDIIVYPATSPAKITGLSNTTEYTFSVTARNLAGSSSAAIATTTPLFAPLHVRSVGYADLQAALTAVAVDGEIAAQAGTVVLTSTPVILNKGVTISGGYLNNYSGVSGYTTIPARVNISASSKVIFKYVKIK